MFAKVSLSLMFLVELYLTGFCLDRFDQSLYWLAPVAALLGIFMPLTLGYLFSMTCQLTKSGELRHDSWVAKLARQVSLKVRRTGEIRLCLSYWQAIPLLMLMWVALAICVAVVTYVFFYGDNVLARTLDLAKIVLFLTGYLLLTIVTTGAVYGVVNLRTGSIHKAESTVAPTLVFFVVWLILWVLGWTMPGKEFYREGIFSFGSILALLCCVGLVIWIIEVVNYWRDVFKNTPFYHWLRILWNGACPTFKIAPPDKE